MAIPGTGSRTANDLLEEISLHLVIPYLSTTLSVPVSPGLHTVALGTILGNNALPAVYVGAQVVVDSGANIEVVVVTAFNPTGNTITANFAKSHLANVPVTGATFPLQQTTDPIFTQSEMLEYLSRAQNEFLEACPCIFAFFYQAATLGNIIQPLPNTAIELERVAASTISFPIASLSRAGGTVTAVFMAPHGFPAGRTFWIKNATDPSFDGVFQVATVPGPTTLTYMQVAADATISSSVTPVAYAQYFFRLYEATQQELFMANRQWQTQGGQPTAFFEDRTGLYRWGLNVRPSYGIPLELLCSVRDTDTLTLIDHFLVPDLPIHIVKYLTMFYALSKDGVFADSQRAQYCQQRYAKGVAAVNRYLDALMPMKQAEQ